MKNIKKACAISDAEISFVSLVNKAANKHRFIITKSENSKDDAEFTCYGRIVKANTDTHFVTGIVYEPMAVDTDNNYMTEEEITKAAYLYVKNNGNVDLQHTFEKAEGANMVESWITKSDCEIEGQPIKKGTWMMTVEITDNDVWDAVEKGDITGFSMGGKGKYSTIDEDIAKNANSDSTSKNSLISKVANLFHSGNIRKGEVLEEYNRRIKADNFWTAFSVIQQILGKYSEYNGRFVFEDDEATIRRHLEEFSEIIIDILTQDDVKSVIESGNPTVKKSANKKEDEEMTEKDVKAMINEAIANALKSNDSTKKKESVKKADEITEADIKEMVQKSIETALQGIKKEAVDEKETTTVEDIQEMISKAVNEAMEPVLKSVGIPTNLDNEGEEIKKTAEHHYMEGVF